MKIERTKCQSEKAQTNAALRHLSEIASVLSDIATSSDCLPISLPYTSSTLLHPHTPPTPTATPTSPAFTFLHPYTLTYNATPSHTTPPHSHTHHLHSYLYISTPLHSHL